MSTTPRLTREAVRAIDRRAWEEYGLSGLVLMENAGRSVADWLVARGRPRRVCICAGKGNNGGDGFVAARHLDAEGIAVEVLLFGDPGQLAGDAAVNYGILVRSGVPIEVIGQADAGALSRRFTGADWIVDALLGTGARGPATGVIATAINAMNGVSVPVLAVDVPSGMDCDTGEPIGPCVRATATVTFVAEKVGFPQGGTWTGEIHVAGIGVPRRLYPG